MKLTKYVHACVVLEQEGKKVVIDPGAFIQNLPELTGVVALIITHEHADHFNPEHVRQIVAANPDVEIFAAEGIAEQLQTIDVAAAVPGDSFTIAPFTIEFFGGKHAEIHGGKPDVANVGVLVNGKVYYPGDSFDKPNKTPEVLLLPTSGPWLKIGEVIDFIDAVKPTKLVIPTHNALQSELGESVAESWIREVPQKYGATFEHLGADETIEL
jgi:L-ascorbate metabolism protein UlaG (beta-lactamase superfamily)